MKTKTIVVAVAVFSLILLIIALNFTGHLAEHPVVIISLGTDKDAYHMGESMEILLSVYSPQYVSGCVVEVSGLKGVQGETLLYFNETVNLTRGENNLTFSYKLPACSCVLGYGVYLINASLIHDGECVNATCIVTIKPSGVPYMDISPDAVKQMLECKDVILLDVRTPSEFNESHIGGALLIPLSELENRLEELDKDKKIIVYCRSGRRSADACAILAEHGFDAYNMLGGILAWEEAGLPVVRSEMQ